MHLGFNNNKSKNCCSELKEIWKAGLMSPLKPTGWGCDPGFEDRVVMVVVVVEVDKLSLPA